MRRLLDGVEENLERSDATGPKHFAASMSCGMSAKLVQAAWVRLVTDSEYRFSVT